MTSGGAAGEGLKGAIRDALASSGNPGMTVEVLAPRWTFAWGVGLARLSPPLAARPNMHFRAASITKMFTAAALMKLAEEGRLGIDDPVEKWLPRRYLDRLAYRDRITLRLLASHRSGIADYDGAAVVTKQVSAPGWPVTTERAIRSGLDRGPLYPPDGGHTYSNVNYLLLGFVIDRASGASYESYVTRAIIEPLGLVRTFPVTAPPRRSLPEPYMRCLLFEGGEWADYSMMYKLYDRAAGDIVSCVGDLNVFHRALRQGKVVGPASLSLMEEFLPASERYEYGLGYTKKSMGGLTLVGHSGTHPGSWTNVYYCVERETYFAFNVNGSASDVLTGAITGYLLNNR